MADTTGVEQDTQPQENTMNTLHLSLTLTTNMDTDEAEQWLVELLQEARLHLIEKDGETIEQRHPIVEVA